MSAKVVTSWPDPGISAGDFRVLPRTDSAFAVIDERRPIGDRTVAVHRSVELARADAERRASLETTAHREAAE